MFDFIEWWFVCVYPPSPSGWPSKWGNALWTVEPHSKCQVSLIILSHQVLDGFLSIPNSFMASLCCCFSTLTLPIIFYFFFFYRTILLSVISLLNEPNTFSPANVDASVMYRRWKDSRGADKEYENIIRKQVWRLFSLIQGWIVIGSISFLSGGWFTCGSREGQRCGSFNAWRLLHQV